MTSNNGHEPSATAAQDGLEPDAEVLHLLADHVPLSLLLDLVALPVGGSRSIYEQEIADLTWIPASDQAWASAI